MMAVQVITNPEYLRGNSDYLQEKSCQSIYKGRPEYLWRKSRVLIKDTYKGRPDYKGRPEYLWSSEYL